ncbi:MAG: gliding motility-associated C-terminal domain-containing protein [Saprospiraceae bacterium]
MNRLVIIGILLLWGIGINGQILPPKLLCVSNDTLTWENPINTCGAFNAYLIWSSENANGPYALLATITNPNQTSFFHNNAGIGTWHYYMEVDANCSGEPRLQSDTLDRRNAEPPQFRYVTVENGQVQLSWNPSPSVEVVGYVISRNTNMGTSIIDTVFNELAYLDLAARPNEGKETYFVVAIDACGNASLTAPLHETIFLETSALDSCQHTIMLSWNLYQNWGNGIGAQTVMVSEDGGPFNVVANLSGTADSYAFDQARGEVLYCFRVIAEEQGTGIISQSNDACTSISVVDPVEYLNLLNASVTPNNEVALSWQINPNAELSKAILTIQTGGSSSTQEVWMGQMLSAENTFTDSQTDPGTGFATYTIEAEDLCGEITRSKAVQTIFLEVNAAEASTNQLIWTPYQNGLKQSIEYEVYRLVDGVETLLSTVPENILSMNDKVDLAGAVNLEACYVIMAKATLQLPDGSLQTVVSRSNTVCVAPIAPFYIPNAFAPNGNNQIFRPELAFGMLEEYQMDIFDRWGGHLFTSKDIEVGWNGQNKGQMLSPGVYLYVIKWRQTNGQPQETSGGVVLMR